MRRRVLRPDIGHRRVLIEDAAEHAAAFLEAAIADCLDCEPVAAEERRLVFGIRARVGARDRRRRLRADVAQRRQPLPILVRYRGRRVDVPAGDQCLQPRAQGRHGRLPLASDVCPLSRIAFEYDVWNGDPNAHCWYSNSGATPSATPQA